MSYFDPNGEPNPDMPESVPSGDKPRWTVDDEGWFKYGSDRVLLALCVFGDLAILPPEARDELKAAVRESAEVPALRERLTAAEAAIRRFLDGNELVSPQPQAEHVKTMWRLRFLGSYIDEPLTPVEAEAIARARADR